MIKATMERRAGSIWTKGWCRLQTRTCNPGKANDVIAAILLRRKPGSSDIPYLHLVLQCTERFLTTAQQKHETILAYAEPSPDFR